MFIIFITTGYYWNSPIETPNFGYHLYAFFLIFHIYYNIYSMEVLKHFTTWYSSEIFVNVRSFWHSSNFFLVSFFGTIDLKYVFETIWNNLALQDFVSSKFLRYFLVSFLRYFVPKYYNFTIKRLQHWCFPVNFVKCLRTPFSQNTSGGCF